jgi:hypothetical protein
MRSLAPAFGLKGTGLAIRAAPQIHENLEPRLGIPLSTPAAGDPKLAQRRFAGCGGPFFPGAFLRGDMR